MCEAAAAARRKTVQSSPGFVWCHLLLAAAAPAPNLSGPNVDDASPVFFRNSHAPHNQPSSGFGDSDSRDPLRVLDRAGTS